MKCDTAPPPGVSRFHRQTLARHTVAGGSKIDQQRRDRVIMRSRGQFDLPRLRQLAIAWDQALYQISDQIKQLNPLRMAESPPLRHQSHHGLIASAHTLTGPRPVSYTHLRAHETGRNLVCRLLLEKKKK